MAVTKTQYRHIHFMEVPQKKGDPKMYEIFNNKSGASLGGVFWYSAWRRFCIAPESGSVFDETCLADIIHFIGQLK